MAMTIHTDAPGSAAWGQRRMRSFNASDAPAMLGCATNKTRTQLQHEIHTSLQREFSDYVQKRVLDAGHRVEELCRPIAAEILEDDLEVIGGSLSVEGLSRPLGASLDGRTFLGDTNWECKSLNDELRANLPHEGRDSHERNDGSKLHKMYRVQMEQQLLVDGAQRCLFTAGKVDAQGNVVEERHCFYYPDHQRRAEILAGWKQLDAEQATFVPEAPKAAPVVAAPQETLPAVSVRVDGELAIISNLPDFGTALRAYIERIPAEPSTDQEFADTEAACKALKRAEDALEAAENNALAQLTDVDTMRRLVADYRALARTTRLQREKLVTQRKEQIRGEIVAGGISALRDHIAALNARLGKSYMPTIPADFAGVIKGKRTIDSLRDAVNTELARAKIAANEAADRIQVNLTTLRELAGAHTFLFADTSTIVLKAADDLTTLVNSRIAEHDAKEAVKLAEQREQIRRVEAGRVEREAEDRRKADEQRVRDEAAERDRVAREQAQQDERTAQAGIAEGVTTGELTQPLASALTDTAAHVRAETVSTIDTRQAIATAQRAPAPAAAAPAAEGGPANLLIGAINDRLGFVVNAAFLSGLGFQPARVDGARRYYRDSDLPRIGRAIAQHTLDVTQAITA